LPEVRQSHNDYDKKVDCDGGNRGQRCYRSSHPLRTGDSPVSGIHHCGAEGTES